VPLPDFLAPLFFLVAVERFAVVFDTLRLAEAVFLVVFAAVVFLAGFRVLVFFLAAVFFLAIASPLSIWLLGGSITPLPSQRNWFSTLV
jgi:hypothetical protein